MLLLTVMDYGKKEELYEQAKKSLKKFKGAEPCGGGGAVAGAAVTVKREPTLINEDAYIAGYRMVPFDRNIGRGRFWNPQYRGKGSAASGSTQRKVNPPGKDGRPLTCRACGSFRHMLTDCPDSWENQKKKSAHQGNVLENEVLNTAVLFTGDEKDDVIRLGVESRFCAVLDSACSSTVCGEEWMRSFLENLDSDQRLKVNKRPGLKTFRFGGGEVLKSKGVYEIPVTLAGNKVTIAADVVESDIPLLLSAETMRAAKIKLDLENDTAEIFGTVVALNHTSAGHYCVPIDNVQTHSIESVCAVKLGELTETERA